MTVRSTTARRAAWLPRALVAIAALSLALAFASTASAQSSSTILLFEECEAAVDEAALREEIAAAARAAMGDAADRVDYEAIVLQSWLAARFDREFEKIVDTKIDALRADRAYLERLLDGNVPSRAREMAERASDAVFNSSEFEALQTDLQSEIAARLQAEVSDADARATDTAGRCVTAFLGARYAGVVGETFAASADAARVGAPLPTVEAQTAAALSLGGVAAAILAIAFRRVVRRIVAAATRRLAGAIAARLAAWASVVLGVAFLAYELIAGADGVFPVIREELLSAETRAELQRGLIEELEAIGPEQLDDRAQAIAAAMFARWREFKDEHRSVLELAEREPAFQAFLNDQPADRMEPLTVAVRSLKDQGGEAAVLDALDRGVLQEAVTLPEAARLLEEWGPRGVGVREMVDWSRRAGAEFLRVFELGLPEAARAESLERDALARILVLEDARAARAVASLPDEARGDALALSPARLTALSEAFGPGQIGELFAAVAPVRERGRRLGYVERVIADPPLMRAAASPSAARSVSASVDPTAALDILLDPAPIWSPFAVAAHLETVLNGRAAPSTLASRYGWAIVLVVGIPLLIALGLLRSLLRLVTAPFRSRGAKR